MLSGSIGDFVWHDVNANGIKEAGEPGVDGVTVDLYESDGTTAGTTATASGGLYVFDGLDAGGYYLKFADLPAGYGFSPEDQGADDALDSDADQITGFTVVFTLAVGQDDDTRDAGLVLLPGAISGMVYDHDTQQPLADVWVDVYQSSDPDHASDNAWDYVTGGETDATGRYEVTDLPPRHYRLSIEDGHEVNDQPYLGANLFDVVVHPDVTTIDMSFDLRAAGFIYGHVYDDQGDPIAGVAVEVDADYTHLGDNNWPIGWSTDADGRYEIYLAPADTAVYPVRIFDAHDYAVQIAPDLYPAALGGTRGPDFHLSLGGVIHGRVTTEAGEPVTDTIVVSSSALIDNGVYDGFGGWTDGNGEYWIYGVPAGIDVYLATDAWDWDDFAIGDNHYAWGERWIGPFNVSVSEQAEVPTLTVPLAGEVRGVVTDVNGQPIVGATVELTGTDIFGGAIWLDDDDGVVTDALGQYSFECVAPGQGTLVVHKDGWVAYRSEQPLHLVREGELLHDVVLTPARAGVTATGRIVNIADVAPTNAAGDILPFSIIDDYDEYDRPGEVGVIAFAPGFPSTVQSMLDIDGALIAEVEVDDGWGDYFEPGAEAAGGYEIHLPAGQHTLVAYASAGQYVAMGADYVLLSDLAWVGGAPGDQVGDVDITIPKGTATIRGTVSFPPGHPGIVGEDSAIVTLRQVDGHDSVFGRALGWAGPSNEYGMGFLPAGDYYLYAVAQGLAPYISEPFSVGAGETVIQDIAFDLGAIVSGTVILDGQPEGIAIPVPDVTITSERTGQSTTTGADGTYQLVGLEPDGDTLTASKPGFAPLSLTVDLISGEQPTEFDFPLVGDTATLTGSVRNAAWLVDGADNNGDGNIDELGEELVGGAHVVAYHTALGQSTSTATIAGLFNFDGLIPGDYALAAYLPGLETAVYGGEGATLTLGSADDVDLGDLIPDHIALSAAAPEFSVTSFTDAGALNVTFYSDIPLTWPDPPVGLVTGAGTLGHIVEHGQTITCQYTVDAADTLVELSVNGTANGILGSRTFGFDVGDQLVEQGGTTFYNAEGAAVAMMGAQDVSSVYIPPFALVGDDARQAITLTATRYGDPGQDLAAGYESVSGVYDFSFTDDGQLADVELQHEATVTLSFSAPAGMSRAEFEASLVIGFYNEATDQWVWNDLANSNPGSGVRNIRVNWVNKTITFKADHFTEFAAALDSGGSIGNFVWHDVNTNGIQDAGEPGVDGVTANLYESDGTPAGTGMTAGGGLYRIRGLDPGDYYLTFTDLPTGYVFTGQDHGSDNALDSDADPATGRTAVFTLATGQNDDTRDAGLVVPPGRIEGSKWDDQNGNGVWDDGEPGLDGVTIYLDTNDNGELDWTDGNGDGQWDVGEGERWTLTGADGSYSFARVKPGAYAVAEVVPVGYEQTYPLLPPGSDDEFQINQYTTASQWSSTISHGADGSFMIAWNSLGQDGSGYGVYARRYGSAGQALGDEFPINQYTTASQTDPTISHGADGSFVIAWNSDGQDGSGHGVYARRYDSAGQALGEEFRVNQYTSGEQLFPTISHGTDGSFAIVWTSEGQDGSQYGVYARRYDSAGQALDDEFLVNQETSSFQWYPTLSHGADGSFVIAWESYGQDGSGDGVYARRYDSAGQALGDEFLVNQYTFGGQEDPAISHGADGSFVIAWKSDGQDGDDYGVYARRYDSAGQALGSEFQVNQYTSDWRWFPSISHGADGSFAVAWESDGQDGDDYGVYARRYSSAGQALGDEFQVNQYTSSDQRYPAISHGADGGLVIAWASDGQDGDGWGVYARRYPVGSDRTVLVAPGQTVEDVDFGNHSLTGPGSISDFVWEDLNADGIQDSGEPGVDGVTVNLRQSDHRLADTTVTAGGGVYVFDGLPSGDYYLEFTDLPAGYGFSPTDRGGDDTLDSDAARGTGRTAIITLAADEDNDSVDAGLVTLGSIGDRAWDDADADGIQDAGEAGVANVEVDLLDAGGQQIETTTTDGNGNYLFTGLVAGDYSVHFHAPADRAFVPADQGVDDALDSDADPATGDTSQIALADGQALADVDAGLVLTAIIGNRVFDDADRDGIQDAGEAGLAGVQVDLLHAGDQQVDTTVTDPDGLYTFNNVFPGDYRVRFTAPAALEFTLMDQGADDAADSDADPATGLTDLVAVGAGTVLTTVDAGLVPAQVFVEHVAEGREKATYTDSNDSEVEVSVRGPGRATVRVAMMDDQVIDEAIEIIVDGSTDRTTLTIAAARRAITTVGTILVNGEIADIKGPAVDIAAEVTTTGPARKIQLHDVADDHTIRVGDDGADERDAVTFIFNRLQDVVIRSLIQVKSLTTGEWIDTNPETEPDALFGPSVGTVTTQADRRMGRAGHFEADLIIDGTGDPRQSLKSLKIAGNANGVYAQITGDVNAVNIGGSANDVRFDIMSALKTLNIKQNANDLTVNVEELGTATVGGTWEGGGATLGVAKSIATKANRKLEGPAGAGHMNNVTLDIQQPAGSKARQAVGSLKVSGGAAAFHTTVVGDVGTYEIKSAGNDVTLEVMSTVKTLKVGDMSDFTLTGDEFGLVNAVRWVLGAFNANKVKGLKVNGNRRDGTPGDLKIDMTLNGDGDAATQVIGNSTIRGRGTGNWMLHGSTGTFTMDAAGPVDGADLPFRAEITGDSKGFKVAEQGFEGDLIAASLARFDVKRLAQNANITIGSAADRVNNVGSFKIGGGFLQSRLTVGARPGPDGQLGTVDDVLVHNPDNVIKSLVIGGAAVGNVLPMFRASGFPTRVKIDGDSVPLQSNDPRFELIV